MSDGTVQVPESTTVPVAAGKYTAKITAGGRTALVEYEIAKAKSTANVPTGLTAAGLHGVRNDGSNEHQ